MKLLFTLLLSTLILTAQTSKEDITKQAIVKIYNVAKNQTTSLHG